MYVWFNRDREKQKCLKQSVHNTLKKTQGCVHTTWVKNNILERNSNTHLVGRNMLGFCFHNCIQNLNMQSESNIGKICVSSVWNKT